MFEGNIKSLLRKTFHYLLHLIFNILIKYLIFYLFRQRQIHLSNEGDFNNLTIINIASHVKYNKQKKNTFLAEQ